MTPTPRVLSDSDQEILRNVNRFRFFTTAQANRLLWPNNTRDNCRYAQLRLRRLSDDAYLQPLTNLPRPQTGRARNVFALGWRGRKVLVALGEQVDSYYRPSELTELAGNPVFMPHTLAVIDVLIAAERLALETRGIALTDLVIERTLRRWGLRTIVPPLNGYAHSREVAVVPDALFSLSVAGVDQHFVLEVDRGTERERVWREKVAALAYWICDPSTKPLLPSSYVAVMVQTISQNRRDALRQWTEEELRQRSLFDELGSMFIFSEASPDAMTPVDFFAGKHWYPAYDDAPDSLVDLPTLRVV